MVGAVVSGTNNTTPHAGIWEEIIQQIQEVAGVLSQAQGAFLGDSLDNKASAQDPESTRLANFFVAIYCVLKEAPSFW